MMRRILILDLALAVLISLGIAKLRQDWKAFGPAHQVSAIQPEPENLAALPAAMTAANPSPTDWTEIPSHNPFSFDRSDIAILAPAEPPKPVGPKPILYGTISLGQGWMALLGPGQTQDRTYRPVRAGEIFNGWTVIEINEKTAIIEANSARETVIMNDPSAQVPRDHTRTLASATASPAVTPTIVQQTAPATTSAAPASGSAPGVKRTRTIQTPFGTVTQEILD